MSRVLIACEFSGIVREAFRARGHFAYSCDLLSTEIPGPHFRTDVLSILDGGWDLLVAHPPCTYLANSGARWLFEKQGRWELLDQACAFFKAFLDAPIARIAAENPMPHKWAIQRLGRKYDQLIQPWFFGDEQKKGTCLWLKGLPPLMSTMIAPPPSDKMEARKWESVWREPPGDSQARNRSRSFKGIANAMAEQWGALL